MTIIIYHNVFLKEKALQNLRENKDIVIQKSDESNTFVTVDKQDHLDI